LLCSRGHQWVAPSVCPSPFTLMSLFSLHIKAYIRYIYIRYIRLTMAVYQEQWKSTFLIPIIHPLLSQRCCACVFSQRQEDVVLSRCLWLNPRAPTSFHSFLYTSSSVSLNLKPLPRLLHLQEKC
jgi:hypothetical protein